MATKKTATKKTSTSKKATKKVAQKKRVAKKIVTSKNNEKKIATKSVSIKKKISKKKAASKKVALKKVAKVKTTVVVNYDAGFGRSLFIRGEGADLNWEKGQELSNEADNKWTWTSDKNFKSLEFKILIDDKEWSSGENMTAACGVKNSVTPTF